MSYRPTAHGIVNREGGYIRWHQGVALASPAAAREHAEWLRKDADDLDKTADEFEAWLAEKATA